MDAIRGRHIKIILYLLGQRYPVSASKISHEIDVNINTLRKDIPHLEKIFKENGLSLVAKPKVGLKIDGPDENKEDLKQKLTLLRNKSLDRKEKIWYIALIFLMREKIPTIEELSDLFGISRPTMVEYIKEIKGWLLKRRIKIIGKPGSGYHIEGSEGDIRDAIIESIKNFFGTDYGTVSLEFAQGKLVQNINGVIDSKNLDVVKSFLDKVQAGIRKEIVDEDLFDIAIAVAVSIRRIRKGHTIRFEIKKINETLLNPISKVIKNNISEIEDNFKVKFADDEIAYLVLKFIGAKVQNIGGVETPAVSLKFKKIAGEIVQLTDELLNIPLNKQDELIFMLAHHLERMIEKVKMGIKIENPTSESLKKEYPAAYAVAGRAKKLIEEELHIKIPEEEVGYIAMYIAASIEKIKRPTKRKVIVICPMGVVTSKLLCYKLTNEIPEIEIVKVGSVKDLQDSNLTQKIDLIISTVPLSGLKIPFVTVSPLLRQEDKKLIKEALKLGKGENAGISNNQALLNNMLIFPQVGVSSSKEVIELLGNALINNGFAKEGFIKEVLRREKRYPTGMSTEIPIAIPHTGPEFTIKRGIAIATLKFPVKFREMSDPNKLLDVKIVLIPVLTGKEEDGREFYEILEKLKDRKLAEEILELNSQEKIQRILIK